LEAAPGSHPGPEAMCDELVRTMLGGAVPGDDVTLLLVQT
jgi:hypothetical protein